MSKSFHFGDVDRITVGTVGPPGQRVFYLQVKSEGTTATFKIEKQQVSALAELLTEVMADLPTADDPVLKGHGLTEPVEAEWVVGTIRLGYESVTDRIVVALSEVDTDQSPGLEPDEMMSELLSLGSEPDDPASSGSSARFEITRDQAAGLVAVGSELVSSGRPLCPLCGYPQDPDGHSCPRTNGQKAPTL